MSDVNEIIESPLDPVYPGQVELIEELKTPAEPAVDLNLEIQKKLQFALETINMLTDLSDTIAVDGVSTHDMTALTNIQDKLVENGFDLDPKVSIENFNGLFTPIRTSLNMNVSQEAIDKTVWETIKGWFFKLIDFVVSSYRWIKSLQMRDDALTKKMEVVTKVIVQLKSLLDSHIQLNKNSNRNLEPKFDEIAKLCLTDPKLPKNKIGLIYFGVDNYSESYTREIGQIQLEAKKLTEAMVTQVGVLKTYLESPEKPVTLDETVGGKLDSVLERLDKFHIEQDDPEYYIKFKVGLKFYENAETTPKRPVFKYVFIYDTYRKLSEELAKLKRVQYRDSEHLQVETIQKLIEEFNNNLETLHKLVVSFQQINLTSYKVYATYTNFLAKAIEVVKHDFRSNVVDDVARVTMERLSKKYDEIIKGLGY